MPADVPDLGVRADQVQLETEPAEARPLDTLARQLARSHTVSRQRDSASPLLNHLKHRDAFLRSVYQYFASASREEIAFSYAAEWVLDNFYIVRQALQLLREDMPKSYYRQLPKLDAGPLHGYPRIYAIAREIIREAKAYLDPDRLRRFSHAYQHIAPLTVGELWALPIMLRLGILECLTDALGHLTGLTSEQPLPSAVPLPETLSDDTIVANSILSLRTMNAENWKVFFEDVSLVDQVLRADPADVYRHMDFETRDRYRKVIEKLAMAYEGDEVDVAREAIRLAQTGPVPDSAPRAGHVGFYLIDAGQAQLETSLGCRLPLTARLRRWLAGRATPIYLGSIALVTAGILFGVVAYAIAAGATSVQMIGAGLLAAIPAIGAAVTLVNWVITRAIPPRVLPKLDFDEGIPAECSTMIVIPALIASARDINSLLNQLELHYLRNTAPNLYFALLTDFADAPAPHMPEDEALIEQGRASIQALNQKYARQAAGPFYLFHRRRQWNQSEGCWMGWERKRGKLEEFNCLLRGSTETSFDAQVGDLRVLPHIKYVITLDADTVIQRGDARRLIGTLAHPLNRAEFDRRTDEVVAGYTILQPRTEIKPTSANQSLFTRVFAGDVGLDLYTRAVSDVYQDWFGEGIYVGKGIYDVDAFERSLRGRVPENTLLSHDLFEGINGRVGLVTDIVVLEDYPPHYSIHAQRLHRWVRGDWQLLPWVLPWSRHGAILNRLSLIDRWKIVDNLRRSLLGPLLLALLVAGWVWLPGPAFVWTLLSVLMLGAPLGVSLLSALFSGLRKRALRTSLRPLRYDALRWFLALAFLPYETLLVLDAILTTLIRLFITHNNLLQWVTAARTARLFGVAKLEVTRRQMASARLLALLLGLLIGLLSPAALPSAILLLVTWLLSPEIAYWIGRPIVRRPAPLSSAERARLYILARRTWLFFERFVGPDDNWLPPDHFQEAPRGLVAHRTSPTNIGLFLLSTLAAYDLGYIGPLGLALRVRDTFDSLDKLERHRGHFLNWYDTRSLEPLAPRYVSTVDSGNLAACLLALKQACLDLPRAPVLRWQRWEGLLDTLVTLAEVVEGLDRVGLKLNSVPLQSYLARVRQQVLAVQDDPERWAALLTQLHTESQAELDPLLIEFVESAAETLDAESLRSLRFCSERLRHHLEVAERELDVLVPWLLLLSQPPALFTRSETDAAVRSAWRALQDALPILARLDEIAAICKLGQARLAELRTCLTDSLGPADDLESAHIWCDKLAEKLGSAPMAARPLCIGYEFLSQAAEKYYQTMDFRFLFDAHRQVFHIGYNASAGKLDDNYYDLLASEARIASLLAIAKGDVPSSHWLHLNRPLTQVGDARVLLSWSGSSFEYLMPLLLVRSYADTLLDQSCRAAVEWQIAYGRQKGVPWGISESGYFGLDANLNYQYRAFGVPGLGFKRGLGEDLVIAPYASLLALSLRPRAVAENVDQLNRLQMLGLFGLYESIDYSRSHLPLDQTRAIVRMYMAHHQGMILLSVLNYLHDGAMIRRFHADPHIQSAELILQEQIPQEAPLEYPGLEQAHELRPPQPQIVLNGWHVPVDTPMPQAHFLSNGRYGVLITSAGSGYSQWEGIDLTRWRSDTTLDDWGSWIYLQDLDSGTLWSATYQPTAVRPESQGVLFYPHQVEFWRRDGDLSVDVDVTVAPDDDVEIRRITLINHGDRPRRVRLTTYSEVALAPQAADRRHPAFNKLFIESEYLSDLNALLFRRRPRSAEEKPIYLAHTLVIEPEHAATAAYESDRVRFLGRGRGVLAPAALEHQNPGLSGTTGATLDPIMALSQDIELEPHSQVQVASLVLATRTREVAVTLARRYRSWPAIEQAFDQARSRSEIELRQLNLTTAELERFQQLLSLLLYPHSALRAEPSTLVLNRKGQSGLWAYGISGDCPILLVELKGEEDTAITLDLLQAHTYWRSRQLLFDLVILNQHEIGYAQEGQERLHRLIVHAKSETWLNRRGGIFLVQAGYMSEADRVLLRTAARVIVSSDRGSLAEQMAGLLDLPLRLPAFVPTLPKTEDAEPTPPLARPADLRFDNGLGGFSADGGEYVIYLEPGQTTPRPWINVVANARFGFTVSESGGGYTWAENSGENRLTPWRNDPVSDTPGEALYLRDEETGRVWSPTPQPAGEATPYLVRHGAGYSTFEHHSHGLRQALRLFAAPDAPVKVVQLRVENTWKHTRRITATYYAEWVLGATRDVTQPYIVPEFDADHRALLARNPYNIEFGEAVAFLATSKNAHGLTADRIEFLGRLGSYHHPAALDRIGLAATVSAGLDPCAAIMLHLELRPGAAEEIFFLIGEGADRQEALRLIEQYQDAAQVEQAWQAVHAFWDRLLGAVSVQTPDPALDLLLNRWLLYQALAGRIWGRSALYQSSGAFGFRDQLQDVMALLHAAPQLARDHLLQAARHQFEAGDVLHWWHPPSGRGIRTRCSDDLVWLPYVTAHYVSATGDESILGEQVPFLRGLPLEPDEEERYGYYEGTAEVYSLYEHCRRALKKGLTAGPHGLPLIGSADWNDSMNRVGIEGRGESVWLGWFLYDTLTRFIPWCESMGDAHQAAVYRQQADDLRRALEAHAWDGKWYRRAYYDDGTPLGSAQNRECRIDSLAQSWAVLSGAADPSRAQQALQAISERLVRQESGLIMLFAPPFDKTPHDPGYIKGYPPGIRENAGQYTHAALWVAWAFAELGQPDRAGELFKLINPIYHGHTPERVAIYQVEPYIVAADVYSLPPHTGRGGWTWYTGSAGWMYRLGLEAILGIRRAGATLHVDPCIPTDWPGYQVTYRYGGALYHILVENSGGSVRSVKQVTLDGISLPESVIPLSDDGRLHEVFIRLG